MYFLLNGGVLASTVKPNSLSWNHFAMTYNNATSEYKCFLNGSPCGISTTTAANVSGQTIIIGAQQDTMLPYTAFGGYMNSFRWTVGNLVYTDTFTVPTSALQTTQASDTNINAITQGQVKLLM